MEIMQKNMTITHKNTAFYFLKIGEICDKVSGKILDFFQQHISHNAIIACMTQSTAGKIKLPQLTKKTHEMSWVQRYPLGYFMKQWQLVSCEVMWRSAFLVTNAQITGIIVGHAFCHYCKKRLSNNLNQLIMCAHMAYRFWDKQYTVKLRVIIARFHLIFGVKISSSKLIRPRKLFFMRGTRI